MRLTRSQGRKAATAPTSAARESSATFCPSSKALPSIRSTEWFEPITLFIAAGAFHVSKPSDLIPELRGRFPIRVELEALGRDEFIRILTEPRNASSSNASR